MYEEEMLSSLYTIFKGIKNFMLQKTKNVLIYINKYKDVI